MTFDIDKSWKSKKRHAITRYLNDLIFTVLVVAASALLTVVAVDAYKFEQTGKCDECVLLGGFYEWRNEWTQ